MSLQAINPATGERLAAYEEITPDQLRSIIDKADEAFLDWRLTSFRSRAALMRQAAQVLRSNAAEYARLMAEEMGKPVRAGVAECKNARSAATIMPKTPSAFWGPKLSRPKPARVSSPSSHWVSYWPSCLGTSRSGKSFASPRPD
jgi:acyl-CoA reductase-like NAD-dependent aldehyde dehydrogenase